MRRSFFVFGVAEQCKRWYNILRTMALYAHKASGREASQLPGNSDSGIQPMAGYERIVSAQAANQNETEVMA